MALVVEKIIIYFGSHILDNMLRNQEPIYVSYVHKLEQFEESFMLEKDNTKNSYILRNLESGETFVFFGKKLDIKINLVEDVFNIIPKDLYSKLLDIDFSLHMTITDKYGNKQQVKLDPGRVDNKKRYTLDIDKIFRFPLSILNGMFATSIVVYSEK